MLDMTTFAPALKQHYTDMRVENLVFNDQPLLALLPKYEKFGGDVMKLPIIHGNPQGRSATFARAQANMTNTKTKAFLLTRVSDYGLAQIQNEVIEASEGDANAFLSASTTEIDGAFNSISRSMGIGVARSGTGTVCIISSSQSGASTTLTASNPDDVMNLELDQALCASATDGGSVGTAAYVVSINRTAGTFQASATLGGSAATATTLGFTAGKYLSVDGDLNAKPKGIQAWIPSTDPSGGESFFGVDRSVDRVRLAGSYLDYSTKAVDEALSDAATVVSKLGGTPSHCFINHTDFQNLNKILGTRTQWVNITAGSQGQIGFQGIRIQGPKRSIDVISDINIPSGEAFMLQLNTWVLASLGKAPKLFRGDGLEMLRSSSADALELRTMAYYQLGCRAPGWNARVKLR